MSQSEFAVVGAGAIGSILAAHLARAGHSVTVLARGQRARQIETAGLKITGLSEFSVRPTVLTDPSQLSEAQTLIIAVKTQSSAQMLAPLRHVKVGTVFSIQNGVLKNELLSATFGAERTLGALADTSGELLPSGEVLFTRNVNLFIGELTGEASERATRIARTIDDAGVRASMVPDIVAREWSKFACWVGLVGLSLTTRVATWRYLSDPDAAVLMARLAREVAALAQAQGIALTADRALLPLQIVVEGSEAEAVEAIREVGARFQSTAPEHRMSSLQDLLAGRALEIEETFGYAVDKGRQLQLSLPLLNTFYHALRAIDRTR